MSATGKQLEFDKQLDKIQLREFKKTENLEVLGELYQKYMHLVYGVCLKYFKDREKAKDGVIQIFEKLTLDIIKQDITNFKSWLYVVTKNFCLMELRKSNNEKEKMKQWQIEVKNFMESGFEIHPIDNDQNKLDNALEECIDKLKNDQKICIQKFYFQEKSYRVISNEINTEIKKVKSHIQNGKRNLKICLESKHVR